MTDNLKTLVFEALGEASMCWEFPEKAGVFQSDRAVQIGNKLLDEINSISKPTSIVRQENRWRQWFFNHDEL